MALANKEKLMSSVHVESLEIKKKLNEFNYLLREPSSG